MNLHEDNDVFIELVGAAAEEFGLPQVYVEKDYWVTKALKHLSASNHADVAVFKGGTSLSKAYRIISRFSEDIDLAVFAPDKGDSARKKLLKKVEEAAATGLVPLEDDERVSKGSKYRKTVHQYPRHIDGEDFGQASPELIIEVNAFTDPEPFESRQLRSLVAEFLEQSDRKDLIETYSLGGFSINVLSVRRTLVEKILGVIKDSYYDDPLARLSDRIRHLYDIHMILQQDEHRGFIEGSDFQGLCKVCIAAEKNGIFKDIECLELPLAEAPLFARFGDWSGSLSTTYDGVFADLTFGARPELGDIGETLQCIKERL